MQKTFLFLLLLPAFAFAQKRVVQQAAYAGLDLSLPSANVGYDARFRSTTGKPDFAVGAWISPAPTIFSQTLGTFGAGLQASALFGSTHAFELGVNSSIGYNTRRVSFDVLTGLADYRTMQQNLAVRPFVGYRCQAPDKRFFLQFQYYPIMFANAYTTAYYNNNGVIVNEGFVASTTGLFSDKKDGSPFSLINLRLGFNLNLLKDTTSTNSAYEAPAKDKIVLQHAVALGLIEGMYDLRWRSPGKVDAAIDLSYSPIIVNGNDGSVYKAQDYSYSAQALALFLQGKANIEAGLMWQYQHTVYKSYRGSSYNYEYTTNSNFIGLPIGFRLQPRRGFFMRCYAAPFKYLNYEYNYNTDPFVSYIKDYHTILDGVRLGVGLGYTF